MVRSHYYTSAHEDFRTTVRRFLERECAPNRLAWQKVGFTPPELWRKAGEAGLLCTKIGGEYGGGGGDIFHSLVMLEEQTRIGFGELTFYLHSDIIAPYIELYGTEEQKQRYLPPMASGEMVSAIAMTEPSGGSDLQAIRTTARGDGNGYVLNGQKVFISNGHIADLIVVAAKTDADVGGKGISLFLLETKNAEGFTRGRCLKKVGNKGHDASELFFDDVRLAPEHLLGGVEGRGFAQLMQRLPEERLLVAMAAVANMEESVRETVAYTSQRQAFGAPLIAMQNTRFKLAECKTKATLGRAYLEQAMEAFIEGRFDTTQGAIIKWWATERQHEVVDACLQLHGGYGYMTEYAIARRYADQRLSRIAGGTSEIMLDLIGRTL